MAKDIDIGGIPDPTFVTSVKVGESTDFEWLNNEPLFSVKIADIEINKDSEIRVILHTKFHKSVLMQYVLRQ